ncbi:SdpA family antimicrobial peptide system protein [Micromonospora sp. NBC_01638]|uniref:SdpA family antimicrobial peptide system protein n=1 Tax=Micromonospora sp. NBC_01638 TaxID=2975982 RepID=UPI00386DCD91|nr:SdpA family antimicrobial peptide system protein [Micromonospora sp. NBC_01638]
MTGGSAATPAATDDVDARTGRRVAAALAIALVVVAYVLYAALPATPFTLPGPDPITVRILAPQGWAFFTKSPRDPTPIVYQLEADGGWRDIASGPRARPRNLMGLDRMSRAQGTELALMLGPLPKEAWQACDRTPTNCLSEATTRITLPNRSNHHSVCGEVGVVVQEVLPWAWRDAPTVMASKVLRVRVQC